ncbi:MAG TPA: pyridoxal-dependent decarboxylase [Stellaceae bacterium]|nr:pyridoxal-dependent decarboxylase [Stellaceae bacterium]
MTAPVPSPLFPTGADRERWDDHLTRALLEAQDRVARGPVTPRLDVERFRAELAGYDFRVPREMGALCSWTLAQLEHGLVHITHPRYFGLFNPGPTFPAQCADRIAAVFNPQLATATTSPVAVAIEGHVIRAIAARAGYPDDAAGHFTNGGAEANYTALIAALTRSNARFAAEGARAFAGAPVFYTSTDCHLAWLKIAHQAGIGRAAVRFVATDGAGRMDAAALAAAIDADRAVGRIPIMVVATAGTTNAGMVDPLSACADIARECGLWLHVDAAWGGALIASDRLRPVLAGIERADSITIDAHKWFAVTMGCGMFLTRHASVLSSAFHAANDFMPSNAASVDPYLNSVQWSRRFLGLRLFLSLAAAGWAGYAAHVEHAIAMMTLLRDTLEAKDWRVANKSAMAVLCLEPPMRSVDVRSIVKRVVGSGRAWVSAATFEGRDIVRACATHGETTAEDVAVLATALEEACKATTL